MRGMVHSYVRRAIQSGSVEARKAILVGDTKSNAHVVKRLQRQEVYTGLAVCLRFAMFTATRLLVRRGIFDSAFSAL